MLIWCKWYDNILSKLSDWQLQPQLLCGQAYDRAGAMAGKSKGVATRIYSQYLKALYTNCAAHRLILCVMKCCLIREVSNMMQIADKISRCFNNANFCCKSGLRAHYLKKIGRS